jgi:hypothetical protein
MAYNEKPDSTNGYNTGIGHEFATTKHIDLINLRNKKNVELHYRNCRNKFNQ